MKAVASFDPEEGEDHDPNACAKPDAPSELEVDRDGVPVRLSFSLDREEVTKINITF